MRGALRRPRELRCVDDGARDRGALDEDAGVEQRVRDEGGANASATLTREREDDAAREQRWDVWQRKVREREDGRRNADRERGVGRASTNVLAEEPSKEQLFERGSDDARRDDGARRGERTRVRDERCRCVGSRGALFSVGWTTNERSTARMPRARASESCDVDASVTRARSRRASRFARRDVTTNANTQTARARRESLGKTSLAIE